ncbi:hypothetical protein Ais01nite_72610 [Asanoa ishikariensis]|uniref:DUF4184 family protein n=1 Tax=Asanoa ishikariensis TaxID=137265 RepID=A0A1H3UQB9_9ACTN|nr:DUF4184 family protein [Asanoa ishikariensis]GIF69226.1 hypothetical protein Ais01nite_72610 [Asanoa ishikariensis]SDZ64613.1 protein of unknown function [Asanoa ishikariensis]
MTFPSHPAGILPLKLWRPRWWDGVALVLGSTTPDLAYLLDGSGLPVWPFSHQLVGLVFWCLPLTLLGCALVRRAAPVVAAQLPAGGRFALRDYGALRFSGHPWHVTAGSALVGAASHLVLDAGEQRFPALEYPGYLVGAIVMVWLALVIGRQRLVRRWHGDPPAAARRPALFWTVTAVVALPGIALTPFLPAAFLLHTSGVRVLTALAVGLLAAALVTTATDDRKWEAAPGNLT